MSDIGGTVFFLFQQMMFFSIPLLIVALGGMFSERSGVVNIALEGIMIVGAFCSILFLSRLQASEWYIQRLADLNGVRTYAQQLYRQLSGAQALDAAAIQAIREGYSAFISGAGNPLAVAGGPGYAAQIAEFITQLEAGLKPDPQWIADIAAAAAAQAQTQITNMGQWILLAAIGVAALTGMLFSLLHAYAAIHMSADQTISGTALNMIAPAFAIYMARMLQPNNVQQVPFSNIFRLRSVPVLGNIPVIGPLLFQNAYLTTYLGLVILAVSAYVLYGTRFGLRLRACGEHPQAADSVGVNVYRIRYAGVLISGALAGLGGLVFVVPTSTNFNATVSGYGFLALAVLIFGQWKPLRILGAALFFGLMKTVSASYSGIPFLKSLPIPNDLYKMIPYIATLVILAFTSRRSQAPRASGVPYDKGGR